jgi:hypothetical protein
MNKLLLLFFLCCFSYGNSQLPPISKNAQISVLTIGPGNYLYDQFGHSAFRVKDDSADIVFNYGYFDFKQPNFYLKFAQGKLEYSLVAIYYDDFKESYIQENRWIKEQVLNLTEAETEKLYAFLKNNYKPENKDYLYDFFYDNCATKMYDVTQIALDNKVSLTIPADTPALTFRELIHSKLDQNSWGSLGIDMALGSVIDRPISTKYYMFLPEYIFNYFQDSKISTSKPLVKETTTIFKGTDDKKGSSFIWSPLAILSLLALFILIITYKDYQQKKRSHWLDIGLFSITGLAGFLMLLLWFATDHTATAQNYNVLWAFPLNLLMLGQIRKKTPKLWFQKYVKFLMILLCLLTLHWLIGVQLFAIGLIPILIAIVVRYLYLIRVFK